MVQTMEVFRHVYGSESISSRHACSNELTAEIGLAICVW